VPYAAAVQDAALLGDGTTAAVALRDSNYLRLYDTRALAELPPVNMNAAGDDHVSFYARHLAPSPCGRFLLVSTDGARMLVLRTDGWGHCRALHGLPAEQFHTPCAAWHRDSSYVFAAGSGGQLLVFHVGSAKLVASLKAHGKALRDMDYDAAANVLATCSFDRSVKVFGWGGGAGAGAEQGREALGGAAGPSKLADQ
jgi:WD40 repeat protein